MNDFEKQQEKEIILTLVLAAIGSMLLIVLCLVDRNYGALAIILAGIIWGSFIGLGGLPAYYREKKEKLQKTKPK